MYICLSDMSTVLPIYCIKEMNPLENDFKILGMYYHFSC
jgi:hypothetical protein